MNAYSNESKSIANTQPNGGDWNEFDTSKFTVNTVHSAQWITINENIYEDTFKICIAPKAIELNDS